MYGFFFNLVQFFFIFFSQSITLPRKSLCSKRLLFKKIGIFFKGSAHNGDVRARIERLCDV